MPQNIRPDPTWPLSKAPHFRSHWGILHMHHQRDCRSSGLSEVVEGARLRPSLHCCAGMEELFSIQALVHYYDKSSVDHAAVKRLLVSARIDSLQLLLSDGSTTTLDNYVLIPRLERPAVADVLTTDGEAPATVAAVVMLAEARAAADSIASSSLELDVACSALERLLASLTTRAQPTGPLGLGAELSIDTCTLNRVYRHGLIRRHRAFAQRAGGAPPPPADETPSSILTAVNARLRLCDLATHCLAVVARQCVTSEDKCREAVVLSTRLLALAASLPGSARDASSSFSSRNSLRTALISGAIHVGVIVSENFGIDISPWVRNANRLMVNSFTGSGRTQVIAAVFGGMIPSCTEYRTVPSAKTAARVMMPLSILHSVLEEQLERTNTSIEAKKYPTPNESVARPAASSGDKDKISKAAQSFLGERVVAAEEDGDEGRISGASGYNACENYIKRAREGSGIRDLLCNLLQSAVAHYKTIQSQLPASSTHVTSVAGEDTDALSDGCTSNSEGHPGSIDLFDHRIHMRAFGYRPSSATGDSEQELGRTLSLHREVAVLCIEALSTWLTLDSLSAGKVDIEDFYSLLEVVCLNASSLLQSRSISTFEVRAALANYGMVCGSVLSQMHDSKTQAAKLWEDAVQIVAKKSRHCVVLMKPLLSFADPSFRAKGMFSCYVADFLSSLENSSLEETKQTRPEDYLLYMMSLISQENSLDLLRVFSDLLLNSSALQGGTPTPSIMRHFAISVHILSFLSKLAYGLKPSKSNVQICIVRLCHRTADGSDAQEAEEITSEDQLSIEDVATLKPSHQVQSTFESILPTVGKVLLQMTSQVLNPMWSIVLFDGQERTGSRTSFSRLSTQQDLADAGEALLDSSVRLRKTIDTLLGTTFMQRLPENYVQYPSTSSDESVAQFFEASARENPEGELLKSLISELETALSTGESISISLLYRLECASRARRHAQSASVQNSDIAPALVKILYACLKRFAEPLAVENSHENPGFLGKTWYEELESQSKNLTRDRATSRNPPYSCVTANLEIAISWCGHIRSGDVESLLKGVLEELSLLIPNDALCLGPSGEETVSMLCDIVCQCWPKYSGIAAKIYHLLKDCVAQVLKKHKLSDSHDLAALTGTLVRLSSWRLFIEKAATCSKSLHLVCHLADISNISQDCDNDALSLALMDNACTGHKDGKVPIEVLQSFRPNSLPALISNLLIPKEEAAVAVQSHAKSLQSFTTACEKNPIWCNACIASLEQYVPSEKLASFPPDFFFRKVLQRSVLDSALMSTAIFELIDVLAGHVSKSSSVVLEAMFSVSKQLLLDQLLVASNDSLYRLLEVLVRISVAAEDINASGTGDIVPRMFLLADFVSILVSCLSKIRGECESARLEDKHRKLVTALMGLLHVCRQGQHQDSSSGIESGGSDGAGDVPGDVPGEEPLTPKPEPVLEPMLKPKPKPKSKPVDNSIVPVESRGSASDGDTKPIGKPPPQSNLCTFTQTGSDFVEQHWYFCYTCGLTGSEGVCRVCVGVCHAGCEISYSRHSCFFCDCGAAGSEAKRAPPVPNPVGCSDSEASTRSGRKGNGAESSSSVRRRKCLCLKPECTDSSDAGSPSSSEAEVALDMSECDDISEKHFPSTGDVEMAVLSNLAPLIERCVKSYFDKSEEGDKTPNRFNRVINSEETATCGLDTARWLLDEQHFFNDGQSGASPDAPIAWNPLNSRLNEKEIAELVVKSQSKTSSHALASTQKIVKGGPFSVLGRDTFKSKPLLGGGVPMAMSCFNEHLAVGQDDGSILFFDSVAVLTCKSVLDKSSIENIGEISVSFPIRHLAFHPDDDETLLVIGDSSVSVVMVSLEPFEEKARVNIELGLNLYGDDVGSSEILVPLESPNILLGADWISHRECAIVVKTKTFVKVFDVDKDTVSPALFVPSLLDYSMPKPVEPVEGSSSASVASLSEPNNIVNVIPMSSRMLSEDWSLNADDTTLFALSRRGECLISSLVEGGDELAFTPIFNIFEVLSHGDINSVSIIALCKGSGPGIFWAACSDGSLVCASLLLRRTNQGLEGCVRSIHHFEKAFESVTSCSILSLRHSNEGVCVFQKGKSLSSCGIFILDENMSISSHFFSGSPLANVVGVLSFFPSIVFGKQCRAGGFVSINDGSIFRLDIDFVGAREQFLNDAEPTEIRRAMDDMKMERNRSRRNSLNKKALIQEGYNPVPMTIGFFETCRQCVENITLSYRPGAELAGSSDRLVKLNMSGDTEETIMSTAPHIPFQFTVSSESSGVLVGARLRFGGTPRSSHRIPETVRVFGREVRWLSRNGVKRWLDIPFTVLESARYPKEVPFELEAHKAEMGEYDGLVAFDAIQLYHVSQSEFADRKAAFDREAEQFNRKSENVLLKESRATASSKNGGPEVPFPSTLHLFKVYDPKHAVALAAVEIARQAGATSLESVARLCLSIGAHNLQILHGTSASETQHLAILGERCRELLQEMLKSVFNSCSKSVASERIVACFLDIVKRIVNGSVNGKVRNGVLPHPRDIEMAIYSLRVVSRLWFVLRSSSSGSNAMLSSLPSQDLIRDAFNCHMGSGRAPRRSYLSAQRVTENAVDAQLVLLAGFCDSRGNSMESTSTANALVRMFCDSSLSIRLFSTRRLVRVLQHSGRLAGNPSPMSEASEDDSVRCSYCCDTGQQMKSHIAPGKDSKVVEASQKWAYRCDNCSDVCENEWWHCMDCEDFDLCAKCIRTPRTALSTPHPETHIFIRGDPDHNLDDFNNANASGVLDDAGDSLFYKAFVVIVAELARMDKEPTAVFGRHVFLDAAQMISILIGPQTKYPTRLKYMEQLCTSEDFVGQVLQSVSQMVLQFDVLKPVCHSGDLAKFVLDWDFAFLFLQVFASVRDSLLLPCLFKCGIPKSFAVILQNLEPFVSEIFRHSISCSSSSRAREESRVSMFEKCWSQRSSTTVLLPEHSLEKGTGADIISLNSPVFHDDTFGSCVKAFLHLSVQIIDFLSFALQSAKGPDVEIVRESVPMGILCDLVSSESRDRRLKSNSEFQKLIQLAKKLLLIVNGSDETKMNRVIDTHIYHTHVSELKKSVEETRNSKKKSKYNIQVEMATTFKSLYRLVCKRPGTWRDFATENPESLETIYKASIICDSQTESTALQLIATACSISKEMAVDSLRGVQKSLGNSGSARFDCPPPKPKKKSSSAHRRDPPPPNIGATWPKLSSSSEDDNRPSSTRSEWMHKCAQSCKEEKQVDLEFFCTNDFKVLKRIVFTLLLERQNAIVRLSCSRILCCIIARAAVSDSEEFVRGIFSVLIVALNRMPAAGALGVELGQSLEVFLSFCYEDFKCLGVNRVSEVASILVQSLRARAASLVSHPNAHIYKGLASVVDIQGYYLEAEPCATCSTEAFESMPPTIHRLDAIRIEAKFTHCAIMCRLVSVQAVSGVSVKVVDPRRNRRVKKIDVYYSPRIVSDSAELKSANHPWRHFSVISLSPSQLESKVELAVPIATANLRFLFSEFYGPDDTSSGSGTDRDAVDRSPSNSNDDAPRSAETSSRGIPNAENLQCPRCSRSVTDRYGICRNCHENAFQCRQCRNINYENLDGFLCNECGYCKHGRFEFSVLCNSSFVSEKVACEEDRKRASTVIEKETAEVHRRHEQLKKMRSTVVQALSLGPKGFAEAEVSKEDLRAKAMNAIPDIISSRADIAALEALLGVGSHTIGESGDIIPPLKSANASDAHQGNVLNALDLSGRQDREVVKSGTHPFSFLTSRGSALSRSTTAAIASSSLSRQTNLLAVLYNKECKGLFLSMSQSIRVLSATRNELMEYAGNGSKRSKSAPVTKSKSCSTSCSGGDPGQSISRTVNSSPCYGCSQSFLSICVDLLYAIARFGGDTAFSIKNAELALELLRLSSLCEKRDVQMHIRRLIVHIVSDNETASDVICQEVSRKIEFCIDSFASIDARSIARVELAVLEDIAHIEDDLWEKRFKTVIHLLFRASKTSLSCASVSETIVLPCLRIALHLLKADESAAPIPLDELPVRSSNGKGVSQASPRRAPESMDSAPSNSNASGAVPELEVASVDLGTAEAVAGSTGNVSHQGDGTESFGSSERPNAFDQLSGSGAPSSIGTAFEEHASDDDSQNKPTSRSTVDVNDIISFLKEAHVSHETTVNVERWLGNFQTHEEWLSVMSALPLSENNENEELYRVRKTKSCFQKWRAMSQKPRVATSSSENDISWAVRLILVAPCAGVRQLASSLLERLVSSEEILVIRLVNMLTGPSLETAVTVGDGSHEFFDLLIKLISPRANRLYLITKCLPIRLAKMIFAEAERLLHVENNLNGTHAFSLSHGFVLHKLVAVLKLLLKEVSKTKTSVRVNIFKVENGAIVQYLQQAFLFIRRLISLRTRLTDECGTTLCEILSSKDYLFFAPTGISVVQTCVSELKLAHDRDDVHTVAVVLKQLCSMLCPETTEPVCYLSLNKAPTQDEYIRGSMSKNPYSSKSFSGPLMRHVKNKICQDLSLPGLLDDDFAMELLVAGNVIKLDLPIMDVYEQVWRGSPVAAMAASSPGIQRNFGSRGSSISGISSGNIVHPMEMFTVARRRGGPVRSGGDAEERTDPPMAIIYRLSGLDGEATEPIIESLESDSQEEENLEELYKSTEILGDVGGLEVLLSLLSVMGSWGDDAETAVREPALKLLRACCEVSKNRSILAATPGTLKTLLDCAASAFEHAHHSVVAVESAESLLIASERILAVQSLGQAKDSPTDVSELETPIQANVTEVLSTIQVFLGRLSVVSSTKAEDSILHLLPFLIQGIPTAVQTAIDYFSIDWSRVDEMEKDEKVARQFATVLVAAPRDYRGQAIVLRALEEQFAVHAVQYLLDEFPMPKAEHKEKWNSSLEHDGPPSALKLLTGLVYGCSAQSIRRNDICQYIEAALGLSEYVIPMLCQLEMVASSNSIGSISEELLEALKENESMTGRVDGERKNLKAARRAAALASRQAILKETGLSHSEPREVVEEKSSELFSLEMFDNVLEETGPACVVCGDGFKSRPDEALGIYVLNRRVPVDCSIKAVLSSFKSSPNSVTVLGRGSSRREAEIASGRSRSSSSGSSSGAFCYSTVSQFNAIHISCHREATRSDRSARREEWEGATLRNSQTMCNNIFPILPPVTCDANSTKKDSSATGALNSTSAAVDFYFSRMSALGRTSTCSHRLVLYDLGRCLIRFADGSAQVFSEHSKGGGPHSNACVIPHLVQLALFTLEGSPAGPGKPKEDMRMNVNVLAVQCDMQKYIHHVRGGDHAYHMAIAVVLLSPTEWGDVLPGYLRLALKEVDEPETALRLMAFADAAVLLLKCAPAKKDWIGSLREHIGNDEAFSVTFADALTEMWEARMRNLKTKEDFWEAINWTSQYFVEKCGEGGRGPNFEEELSKVTNKL